MIVMRVNTFPKPHNSGDFSGSSQAPYFMVAKFFNLEIVPTRDFFHRQEAPRFLAFRPGLS
jgi:hypothetical protein